MDGGKTTFFRITFFNLSPKTSLAAAQTLKLPRSRRICRT